MDQSTWGVGGGGAGQTGRADTAAQSHRSLQSHHRQVVVEVDAHIVLGVQVDSGDADLLLVDVLNVLVPISHPHHEGHLGVVLQAVGGSQEVAGGDDDGPAPVEGPGAAPHPDWREC